MKTPHIAYRYLIVAALSALVPATAWSAPQEAEQAEEDDAQEGGGTASWTDHFYYDDGLWVRTEKGDFRNKLGGLLQLDSAAFVTYPSLEGRVGTVENGVQWRRARIDSIGGFGARWAYRFRWDFTVDDPPNLKDAFLEFHFRRLPLSIRGGRFSSTFGLENQGSAADTVFMEAGLPAEFVPPQETGVLLRSTGPNTGRLDIGFAGASDNPLDCVVCDVLGVTLRYGKGFEYDEGRKLVHIGGDFARRWVNDDFTRVSARPESNLSPALIDTGLFTSTRTDVAMAEGAWVNGPFSIQGEYATKEYRVPSGNNPRFHSSYVFVAYTLTGEQREYDHETGRFFRLRPAREFRDGAGGQGAFEIAARYSRMDLNDQDIKGGILNDVSIAGNWYPTHTARVLGNIIWAKREGAAAMWIFQFRLQFAL